MNQADFYPSSRIDPAVAESVTGFDPQMPLGTEAGTGIHLVEKDQLVPPGVVVPAPGKVRFNFMARNAQKVEVEFFHTRYPMKKRENGLWTIDLDTDRTGFNWIVFYVNDAEIINPTAPIGYGASRPINYAELPDPEGGFYSCRDVPHGCVRQEYFYSDTMGLMKSCLVYTPPKYETSGKIYPVLYLQHGHGENETCWIHQGKANFIFDNLIAEEKMIPCVVVMNNGMTQQSVGDLRKFDMRNLSEMLIHDCIPFIESMYRVRKDKWSRAMAGLSMGSFQTSYTTLSHPGLFGYAGVFSGFVQPMIAKNRNVNSDYLRELDDVGKFKTDFAVFFRGNGDADHVVGDIFQSDDAYFKEHHITPEECPNHVRKIYRGEHEWNVWRRCLRDFMPLIFREH